MKTVSEVISWLKSPTHIKCVLVDVSEVGAAPKTSFNFSTIAYTSGSVVYEDIITGGLAFSESLSLDGSPSLSFGSLDISNVGGLKDEYLQYVWNKRPVKIYLGDQSWSKSDFVLIFDGLIQEITAQSEDTLSFALFDKLQRLNDPVTEKTLKQTNYTQKTLDTLLPLTFGECFNVQPLYVDTGATTNSGEVYMAHDGPIQGFIEVRDNGVPVAFEEDITKGTFALLSKPYGTITCSVQGSAPYSNTVAGIITKLVTEYGSTQNRFQTSDLEFSSFTNTSAVGIYLNDRKNILEACTELAASVNANLVCPAVTVDNDQVSNSKLKLVEIKIPTDSPKYYLTDNNIILDSLSISEMLPVKPSIKLGYCKNFSPQDTVAAGVVSTSNFKDEYIYVTNSNSAKQLLYRDSGEVSAEPTLLITTEQAQAECDKRLTLWQDQRVIVTAKYLPELIFVQLGDTVELKASRFGLSTGKKGLVYSVTRDWISGEVGIGVLI